MSNNIRKIIAATAAATLSLGLVACGGGGSATTPGADGTGDAAGANVTIELWDYLGQGVSNTAMEKIVEAFEDANSNITVNRTSFAFADLSKSIVQGGVGGQVPDVAIVDVVDTQTFASLGLLQDVTDSFGGTSADFFPGPWESTQLDGQTYALPLNSNNLALYYNKAIFEQAGAVVPTTWDELREVAKTTSSGDNTGIAMSAVKSEQGTFQFLPFLWQTGGDLNSFETDGATALSFLKSLIDDGSMSSAVANYTQEDARTQFVTGKTAMMINGPWELQNLRDSDIDFGVAQLPAGEQAASGLGGENVVTFEQAQQPEAAQKFLEFITSAEGAKIYCNESGQLSARVDLQGELTLSEDPDMQVFEKQLEVAHARAFGGDYPELSAAVQEALQLVTTGAASPEDAAAAAAETINSVLG